MFVALIIVLWVLLVLGCGCVVVAIVNGGDAEEESKETDVVGGAPGGGVLNMTTRLLSHATMRVCHRDIPGHRSLQPCPLQRQ